LAAREKKTNFVLDRGKRRVSEPSVGVGKGVANKEGEKLTQKGNLPSERKVMGGKESDAARKGEKKLHILRENLGEKRKKKKLLLPEKKGRLCAASKREGSPIVF